MNDDDEYAAFVCRYEDELLGSDLSDTDLEDDAYALLDNPEAFNRLSLPENIPSMRLRSGNGLSGRLLLLVA